MKRVYPHQVACPLQSCSLKTTLPPRGKLSHFSLLTSHLANVATCKAGIYVIALCLAAAPAALPARAQVLMTGRLFHERASGSDDRMPLTAILGFAALTGTGSEPLQFRTWETEPAGWYRFSGSPGNYTLLFTDPAGFMRPILLTNVYTKSGDNLTRDLRPHFDHAVFDESAWDEKPASDYFQTFVARGSSLTQVGFRLVHDGVDGIGPGGQNLLVSIHRKADATPDTWPQVGPTVPVLNVDTGGAKNYIWSAGWNSGEVPLEPGQTYAVHLRAENSGGTFQAFWRADDDRATDCYRISTAGTTGWQNHDLWLAVSADDDGLLIPYNKRVHKQFGEFAGGGKRWAQTYVAQGRSLAAAIMYAAVGTAEPALARQRCVVRVHRGGPTGPVVGIEKIAIGNGTYTGDASWGVFAAVYAPGEVPLVPGETYAIEYESIENYYTLHGHTNIKGAVSTEKPGFNPYRKWAPDDYPEGTAHADARTPADFDLDMQIIEYEHAPASWADAVDQKSLLPNGDMEAGRLDPDDPAKGKADAWHAFAVDLGTVHHYLTDPPENRYRFLRVTGGGLNGKTVDGGYVQRVDGLSHLETYRLVGRVRSSWPADVERHCRVGIDPTGQTDDPDADTIAWSVLPPRHGHFVDYNSGPIRPAKDANALSVWLRGYTRITIDQPFKADFDDFILRRVNTGIPNPRP